MDKTLKENLAELESKNLPPHLKAILKAHYEKCAAFGIDPDWASKARKKAEGRGDDFNPIHAMIG